jgi:hypothetical protein
VWRLVGRRTAARRSRASRTNVKEPRTPETGHTALLPGDEQVVTLPMDNGWTKAISAGKLPEVDDRPVVIDMDPAADPVLFWSGKDLWGPGLRFFVGRGLPRSIEEVTGGVTSAAVLAMTQMTRRAPRPAPISDHNPSRRNSCARARLTGSRCPSLSSASKLPRSSRLNARTWSRFTMCAR